MNALDLHLSDARAAIVAAFAGADAAGAHRLADILEGLDRIATDVADERAAHARETSILVAKVKVADALAAAASAVIELTVIEAQGRAHG